MSGLGAKLARLHAISIQADVELPSMRASARSCSADGTRRQSIYESKYFVRVTKQCLITVALYHLHQHSPCSWTWKPQVFYANLFIFFPLVLSALQ